MSIIALDFESYYDANYSLSKLSTEEYLRDPRFEVIGCSVSINGRPAVWYPQSEVASVLTSINWETNSLLCYNTVFDGAILAWHYGLHAALYLDAMGMAKALGKTYKGASLAKVAELMGVGVKGTYVVDAKGKRYADFTPHELAAYGSYCCNDTDLTVKIYKALAPSFPLDEAKIQDRNLRLFIQPLLRFDVAALQDHHDDVVKQKQEKIATAIQHCQAQDEEDLRSKLASNPQFAELLTSLGVDPPKKLSKTTGKETFAFAKTDEDFVALLQHEDLAVQAVVAARLGVKSTIEETRSQTFMDIARRGPWPVQINYCGANTTRFSGAGGANPQNLKRGGKLRYSIQPPPGHHFVVGDLGQIECRMVNYLAGQEDVIEAFRAHDRGQGADVYCIFAEKIYGTHVPSTDKPKRTVGKVGELSLGYGAAHVAFKSMLFVQGKGMVIQEHESRRIVDIYRRSHAKVVALWDQGDAVLRALMRGQPFTFGKPGVLDGTQPQLGIGLPSGLFIQYPELRQEYVDGKFQYVYTNRNKPCTIHGAVVVQNVTEALTRIILTDAWLRVADRLRVVMHTHDELACVVPHADVEDAMEMLEAAMTWPVSWAPDLPLACEVKRGRTYGEARE